MSKILFKYGTTRTVLLTKNYAFKFPTFVEWRLFLKGLLGNIQETQFSPLSKQLCPVLFSIPGGFLVVMPRCKPLTLDEFSNLDYESFIYKTPDLVLPVENKLDSFGLYEGRIVAVDYGS